jgi:molybdate transport system substrate-binding protein
VATPIDIKVMSTTAMKTVFEALSAAFENETGSSLNVSLAPSAQLETRLDDGEAADAAILTAAGAEQLVTRGRVVAGSLVAIASSSLGVAVPKGAPKPDISSVAAFKEALLAAKSIAVGMPVGGGQSGAHMLKVFTQLGIAEAMHAKAKYGAGGPTGLVGLILLRGDAEIGMQQFPELMGVPGIDIVGPLPMPLQSVTRFVAAIPVAAQHADTGRALIAFLTTPGAKRVIKAKGLEPA